VVQELDAEQGDGLDVIGCRERRARHVAEPDRRRRQERRYHECGKQRPHRSFRRLNEASRVNPFARPRKEPNPPRSSPPDNPERVGKQLLWYESRVARAFGRWDRPASHLWIGGTQMAGDSKERVY